MSRPLRSLAGFTALIALTGCGAAGGKLGTLQTQNRILLEQTKAQLAEIENLKSHARRLEDKLIEAENRLALQEERTEPSRRVAPSHPAQRPSQKHFRLYERSCRAL